ncbi:MFS transporter, SP family, arabinose:H+ symporter [Vibrio xiamenensis]|uniref:MFS transporter, SP family, arabinose:H+ symporter n=1 Tax=Vibrio xiamenensis TaxID=861298 RepID=A0A1G8BJ20_9VIBR|nr:sugar porter family MFS transporter [Vibrio xiamenensis]SDH33246.1 MFS transporter, SP family, arabinose:H+ symporter [Vibrio xiamenensis]
MLNYNTLVSVAASLAGLLFGLDIGLISGALPFITNEWSITIHQQEWIVSTMMLGATLGSISNNWLSAILGRKRSLMWGGIIFALGTLGCTFASNIEVMLVFRVVQGFAIGIASFAAPLYLSEMSDKSVRGRRIATYQLMVTVGILLAFLSDTWFAQTGNWRMMFAVLLIPTAILVVSVYFIPRSPRWLASRGYMQEAQQVLLTLRMDERAASTEFQEIIASLKVKQSGFALFKANKNFRRSVGLGIALQFMQQFTGMNILMYYAPKIFEMAGFTSNMQQMFGTVLVGVAFVAATFIAIAMADSWGRKPALKIGFTVMGLGMFCLGLLLKSVLTGHAPVYFSYLAVVTAIVCICGYAMSAAPMVWILCSEVQPLKGRDFGIACSTTMNWISNMVLGATFLTLLNGIGTAQTFWLYAVFNFIFVAVTVLFVPETKGVTLESIEANLMAGKELRYIGLSQQEQEGLKSQHAHS